MKLIKAYTPYIAWSLALLGMLISLYFSNVLHYQPCPLCWYQRIAMYPLVFILGVGILRRDRHVYAYALPLSILGMIIALYHNLIYFHFIPEKIDVCAEGISCVTKQFELFGFVNIPFMSLVCFILITILMLIYRKENQND